MRVTFNAQMVSTGVPPQAFGNLANYIAANPTAKFIAVPSALSRTGTGKPARKDTSGVVGTLARRVTQLDPAPAEPPAVAVPVTPTIAERLQRLDALKSQGLVTETEYAAQRTRILSEL